MNKRIGILLLLAAVIMTVVDSLNLANTVTIDAVDVYNIAVRNVAISAFAGIVVFGAIALYNKRKTPTE